MADAPIINVVNDFDAANDFEKKHTPHLSVTPDGDRFLVTCEVGHEVPHPNGPDHYITWIGLYVGMAEIARFDLSPVTTDPKVTIPVSLPAGTAIRAIEHCNLHGYWEFGVTL